LSRLGHSLTQVTLVVPENPYEPQEYRAYLRSLPERVQGAALTVLERENSGMSYGSWSHAFGRYRRQFDYYLFLEDDYVPCQPRFDRTLVEMFRAVPRCGYLCSLVAALARPVRHAAIANGLASAEALERIWQRHGMLPHAASSRDYGENENGQVVFSTAFEEAGFVLADTSSRYTAPYCRLGQLEEFQPQNKEHLIIPVELLKEQQEEDGQ
jgi:hypothetical protein